MEEYEKFYGKIIIIGDSHAVTIPATFIKGLGLKQGDILKIMFKKEVKEDEETKTE